MRRVEVAIIGTGFGGLGMAIQLQKAGINDIVLLEKSDEVGGCWRENHYPAAACDVPSHLYSFSFEPKADWSRKFAPQREIKDYLRHCADKYQLWPYIQFQSEVAEAAFDEQKGWWTINLSSGEQWQSRILISACGQLSRPAIPKLKGIEQFGGQVFHSAQWPEQSSLVGKRVAVVGTGASAIQFVPEVAKEAASLVLLQRSAPYVIPKPDRAYGATEQQLYRRYPLLQRLSRAMLYGQHEVRALAFTIPQMMKPFEWQFQRYIKQAIPNPELRAKLMPDYPMGCKRILISNHYYEALSQPHVTVETSGISEVTAQGIRVQSGQEYPVDVIIYGTGFAATDFLAPMKITGRQGVELNSAWKNGAEAFLGISVSAFPNLFILYGPNTNLGHNSIVYMLECQFDYILQALKQMRRLHLRWLDVKHRTQDRYNTWLQEAIQSTVWEQGCHSWYKTAEGKNTNNWPSFTWLYRQRTREFQLSNYDIMPHTLTSAVPPLTTSAPV